MRKEELFNILLKFREYFIVVEGKKDKEALKQLNFREIFVLNEAGKSLFEKIEEIETRAHGKKICILTDFDKKGKKLYLLIKKELASKQVKLDNSLRVILLRHHVSHIEGLAHFVYGQHSQEKVI